MRTSTIVTVTAALLMAACVDTTGLTGEIHTDPHPSTSRNALVTITEYADIQCPACRAAHATLTKPLIEKYGTQISFDYRHFPLTSIHRYAMEAAEGAECAGDQGKFWEFLNIAYEHQSDLSSEALRAWAGELRLDAALFDRCVSSRVKRKAIQASYDEGRAKGVQGTPTFFVNGQQTNATMEDMSAAIDAALRQAAVIR
jgi:protein-disulfide isomerase